MDYSTGKLSFIFIASVVLACAAAWVLAWRYRAAMRRLMSAPLAPAGRAAAAVSAPPLTQVLPPADPVTAADNRRAGVRLSLLLIGLSCLMALSSATLQLALALEDTAFSMKRVAVIALVHLWPVIPALGLMWRWSKLRVLGVLLAWCAFCFVVMLWRSIEPRPLDLLLFLLVEIGPTLVLVALLCMGSVTRAIAPWLLPVFIGLVWASIAGIDVLAWLVERRAPVLMALSPVLTAETVMLLFALLPWLLAAWPLWRFGRALGRAYARKQLSELMVLFTAVWAVSLLFQALSAASSLGLGGAVMLLPLLWIPFVMRTARRPERGRPPTLLVLRVFQHAAQVQALFDHVVERWRLSGNTVLIAGTDLMDRTLDADDIFTFLDGGLAQRFISRATDVPTRLAGFDLQRDADGRYRVNECYCHDTTWQEALAALVQHSDVVLMDLRSFQAHNAGCRHELKVLAQAPRLARVVVLVDAQTDRTVAAADTAGAPAGRFVWLDVTKGGARERKTVLQSLFVARPAHELGLSPASARAHDARP